MKDDKKNRKKTHQQLIVYSSFLLVISFILLGGIISTVKCNENKLLSNWGLFFIITGIIVFFPWFGWIISLFMIIIYLFFCRKFK
jgi:hypothetical protein